MLGAAAAAALANPRGVKRGHVTMAGLNQNLTDGANKRNRGLPNKMGRPSPDFPQNVISTTVVLVAPPKSMDPSLPESKMYAPPSLNALADTPSRGDWAFNAPFNTTWLAKTVSSGQNPYGNAIPVFTNMAAVPVGTKIRFAGIVGNPGQAKEGDESRDNWGNVYSSGSVTGRNTGPEFIPPLSLVYFSPFSYVKTDASTKQKYPGYSDPGWDQSKIDKYQPAAHALRDADVVAFFHHVKTMLKEAAKKNTSVAEAKVILSKLGAHNHLPVYTYAEHYLQQARVEYLFEHVFAQAAGASVKADLTSAVNKCIKHNQAYWTRTEAAQKKITDALGGPEWDTRRASALDIKTVDANTTDAQLMSTFMQLKNQTTEIMEVQFCEMNNFIHDMVAGKSRYGSPSEAQLDIMLGYRL